MESLYKRMEDTLHRKKRPSDISLSRQLFLWAIYARRSPTISELSEILEAEFGVILDMKYTINQLCGQFVIIEGNNRIGLLHKTAREYPTTHSNLPFSLDPAVAHQQLFAKCMSVFLEKNLRSRLNQSSTHTFLEYRALNWAFHLANIGAAGDLGEQLDLLTSFLDQPSVLVWIFTLASLGRLQVLIEASRSLASFALRRRRIDAVKDPTFRRLEDLELLEAWSKDLLRLLGKFGSNILEDPSAIYRCIAPFCPRSSAIYRRFHSLSPTCPTVNGLSDDWDDCLARVFVDIENLASMIACSGRLLAVVNGIGTIVVWDCVTFDQVQILEHGESIFSLCFNNVGDRIVTYGFRTTKVWSARSGRVLHSIQNASDTQALCLRFTVHDEALMMGSDRRTVLTATVEDHGGTWQKIDSSILTERESKSLQDTFMNSPIALAFSPDGTKIAAAYRRFPLSIWSLSPAQVMKRIDRGHHHERSPATLPFASHVSWHPNSEELVGVFQDGYIFRDKVFEDQFYERAPESGHIPEEIRCSPDGRVLATYDLSGKIKLYDYESLTLIYLLSSEDMITALVFSQDGTQFYDIRGSYCNVWELNALIRLSGDGDDHVSEANTGDRLINTGTVSEAFAENVVPITILLPMPSGSAVCMGNDDGAIDLYDYETNQNLQIDQSAHGLSIENLTWSEDASHFSYSDTTRKVNLVQVSRTERGWNHRLAEKFDVPIESGGIKQLLLSQDSNLLLVALQHSAQLWSTGPPTLRMTYEYDSSETTPRWAIHPLSKELILSVTPDCVKSHAWADLKEVSRWTIGTSDEEGKQRHPLFERKDSHGFSLGTMAVEEMVHNVLVTHYHPLTLIRISRHTGFRKLQPTFMIFDANSLKFEVEVIYPVSVPRDVMNMVQSPLNVLQHGCLVYIDRSFWICRWNIGTSGGSAGVHREFFIPRDWLNTQSLELMHVTASGSILCPRKGALTVIETSLGKHW